MPLKSEPSVGCFLALFSYFGFLLPLALNTTKLLLLYESIPFIFQTINKEVATSLNARLLLGQLILQVIGTPK